MRKITDTERLDWLGKLQGSGLINDDYGRWAIPECGIQNVTDRGKLITKQAIAVSSTFFTEAREWKLNIRAAIDAAMRKEKRNNK